MIRLYRLRLGSLALVTALMTGCEKGRSDKVEEVGEVVESTVAMSSEEVKQQKDADFDAFMKSKTYARIVEGGFQPALVSVILLVNRSG